MRTLVVTKLRPSEKDISDQIKVWLTQWGCVPSFINLPELWKKKLKTQLEPTPEDKVVLETMTDIPLANAIKLLFTIPQEESERLQAVDNIVWAIRFDEMEHKRRVSGIICIEDLTISFRWRFPLSRSLEITTEILVENMLTEMKPDGLFSPFVSESYVSVREPLHTEDAYKGLIKRTDEYIKARAKKDKANELKIYKYCMWFFFASLLISLSLFSFSHFYPQQTPWWVIWVIGFCDRLATTALATGLISYLSYRFYKNSMKNRPTVEWV